MNVDKERELFEEWWKSTGIIDSTSFTTGVVDRLTINYKELAWVTWQERAKLDKVKG